MTEAEFKRRYKCIWRTLPNPKDTSARCQGIALRGGHYFRVETFRVEDSSAKSGFSERIAPSETPLRPLEVLRTFEEITGDYFGDDHDWDFDRLAEMFRWLGSNLVEKGGAR